MQICQIKLVKPRAFHMFLHVFNMRTQNPERFYVRIVRNYFQCRIVSRRAIYVLASEWYLGLSLITVYESTYLLTYLSWKMEGRTYPLANHRSMLDRCIQVVDELLLLYYFWQNITVDKIMISDRAPGYIFQRMVLHRMIIFVVVLSSIQYYAQQMLISYFPPQTQIVPSNV